MQRLSHRPIKTFTIGFSEANYNEAEFAKDVAVHLGTEHTELYVSPKEAWEVVPQLHTMYDEPFADSSQVPTYLVSKLARQHVTVSLSGDGGDELFGGYNRYFLASKIWNQFSGAPNWLRGGVAGSLSSLSPEFWDQSFSLVKSLVPKRMQVQQLGDKLHKVARIIKTESELEMYLQLIAQYPEVQQIVPNFKESALLVNHLKRLDHDLDGIEKMMYLDFCTYMSDDILVKVDRASMAVSLESRIPFLDRRVIEYAWSLPLSQKIKNGQGKWPLRNILYKHVPKNLIERPKMGFGVPVGEWIKGPLRDWAESLLSKSSLASSGLLNEDQVQILWEEHLSGKRNWQAILWTLLMFQQWNLEKSSN